MKFVTVFTKARTRSTRKRDEKVYLRKRLHRGYESWFGMRWRRGMWTASISSGEAAMFESLRAAHQIIKRALWCKLAVLRGWRASVHVVKSEHGSTSSQPSSSMFSANQRPMTLSSSHR